MGDTETIDPTDPALQAERAKKHRPFRRVLFIVLAVIALAMLGMMAWAGVLIQRTNGWIEQTWTVDVTPIAIPEDAASIEEGHRLYLARGCGDCHGENGAGRLVFDGGPVGRYVAPNLTTGARGLSDDYSADDWVRAVRHGVNPDGRALIFMPSHEYAGLSDDDLGRIVAWVRTQAPLDGIADQTEIGPLAKVLAAAGKFPLVPAVLIDHDATREPPPEPGPTVAFGAYLAATCTGCHGAGLAGGPMPGAPPDLPPPSNLTMHSTGLGDWSLADFETALREGTRPDGTTIDEFMPVRVTRYMTDVEIEALWAYLGSLPALPYGAP